ncbi:thyrotroph embryonic factor-like isoform X2 [Dermacentor albipictus]|uniref:thyrotroph embryonic factor-like isoform X2 n=1 Tax=Dermacentor albipictus TaxID=60249 RepID=UPI0038FC519C
MLSMWSVTGMAKNHHCVSVVYRDTTQADYDVSGETFNHSSTRHASASSNHLDTDLPSPTRMYNGLPQEKVLTPLDKPTAEAAVPAQAYSPATMDMWEQNETFQDLSELIQEEKPTAVLPPVSSQSCYTLPSHSSHRVPSSSSDALSAPSSSSCNSSPSPASQTTWQLQSPPPVPPPASTATTTAVSVKRSISPIDEPGPSHASGRCSPKLQKLEEPPQPRYTEMRVKNNMASRRSRMTRKEKELEMEKRASELEQENEILRIKVKNLEELTDRLKKHLINSIVKK